MSKMPAKKKSCFQITSVTQAQVAGSGQPDDTESLDDPDESRTEDISSSEIFDNVSRAELEPGGERSSSEEALNNVGESEPQNKPHSNGGQQGFVARDAHGSGQQGTQGPSQASQTSQLPQSSSSGVGSVSCSSRFRLIKLDHGTGEPFRRGRWTCTEYYEKDPDGGRTVDSIRHTSVSLSEQGTDKDRDRDRDRDRDSGLGATGGSVVAESSGLDPVVFHHFDLHGYGNLPQQQVPPGSGTPDLGGKNVIIPHGLLPPGNNGLHQGVIQKSPGVAPAQAQSLIYPAPQQTPQQLPLGHHLVEYGHLSLNVSQTHPGASLPVVHPVSQGPSPVPTPAVMAVPGEMAGLPAGVAVTLPGSQPGATIPNLMAQIGTGMIPPGSSVQLGQFSPASLGNAQTLPASTGAPASMPATGGVPVPSASLSQAPVARNGVAGPMVAMSGFVQPEEGRRKSDAQAQAPLTSTKDLGKPLISEDLPLASSGVNTLFGIAIPIDGDDDRNPSTVFFRAFQHGSRLCDSKPLGDSASGASVVAIDNKIEQAMDLVKSHLMYAVREEVEVLKEQIKELYERNSVLERENAVLKSLANTEQLSQLSAPAGNNNHPNNNPSTNLSSNPSSTPSHPPPPHQPDVISQTPSVTSA